MKKYPDYFGIVLFFLSILVFSSHSLAGEEPEIKRILALSGHQIGLPWDDLVNEGLERALGNDKRDDIALDVEYLDLSRNPSDDYKRQLSQLLETKYRSMPPDIIISTMEFPEARILGAIRPAFPSARVISLSAFGMPQDASYPELNDIITVSNEPETLGRSIELIAASLPGVKNIFFVNGDTPNEQKDLEEAKAEFKGYGNRFHFSYLSELPVDELLEKLSRLPANSAIFFTTYFQDPQGKMYIPLKILERIHKTANAPIFGTVDTFMGHGIAGGELISAERMGEKAGELAIKVLDEKRLVDGVSYKISPVTMFDWREMRRWGINEKNLPEGSIVRFRQFSFYEHYRWHLLIGFGFLLLQTALIAFLWITLGRHKRAEKALLSAEREKRILEAELHQAQKLESLGTLAGGIAHDFNNILTAILGYTEYVLLDVEQGSDMESALQQVMTAGKRARGLVGQILTFARKSEGDIKLINVQPIAEEALKLLRSTLPASIEIKSKMESDALIMADPTRIHQIFMNLCVNAAQAMDGEGVLEVAISGIIHSTGAMGKSVVPKPGEYVRISVSDTGSGISEENIVHIFEPYFTTKGVGSGTGLGLSVVLGIVKSYGGEIVVTSRLHEGTTFTVDLPVGGNANMQKARLI